MVDYRIYFCVYSKIVALHLMIIFVSLKRIYFCWHKTSLNLWLMAPNHWSIKHTIIFIKYLGCSQIFMHSETISNFVFVMVHPLNFKIRQKFYHYHRRVFWTYDLLVSSENMTFRPICSSAFFRWNVHVGLLIVSFH